MHHSVTFTSLLHMSTFMIFDVLGAYTITSTLPTPSPDPPHMPTPTPTPHAHLKPFACASRVPGTLRPLPPSAGRIHRSGRRYTRLPAWRAECLVKGEGEQKGATLLRNVQVTCSDKQDRCCVWLQHQFTPYTYVYSTVCVTETQQDSKGCPTYVS